MKKIKVVFFILLVICVYPLLRIEVVTAEQVNYYNEVKDNIVLMKSYDSNYDINNDGVVDVIDAIRIEQNECCQELKKELSELKNDLSKAQIYDTNNLLYKTDFCISGSYYVGQVNPNGVRVTTTISVCDDTIDASGLYMGIGDGTTVFMWLINNGNVSYESFSKDSTHIMFYPNSQDTFNTLKKRYNIMVNEGEAKPYESDVVGIRDAVNNSGHIKDYGTITVSNYKTILPDLNEAPNNSEYVLNFGIGEMPANVPDYNKSYYCSILITCGDAYKTQILIDNKFIYKRVKLLDEWKSWTQMLENEPIVADSSSLISILKMYNGKNKTIYLSSGIYDIYQMYIDYYGEHYWDNYNGYDDVEDPFANGLWLENIELIGLGDVNFIFSGETTEKVSNYFSFFAPTGITSIKNIQCDIGLKKVRYCIHDDYAAPNSKITYENIVFYGTPYMESVIGAGFRIGCTYEIKGCVFLDNNGENDISYHSHGNSSIPCELFISNCYGLRNCIFKTYGINPATNKCIVNNSTFNKIEKRKHEQEPHDFDNINLIKYLCDEKLEF